MKVDVKGVALLKDQLLKIKARTLDLTPVMQVVVSDLDTLFSDSFRKQASPWGQPWERLADSTKAKKKIGYKILVNEGFLKNSFVGHGEKDRAVFGTSVFYGKYHQFGTRLMPARPIFPVTGSEGNTVLVDSGPARKVFDRIRKRIKNYILNGRTTPDIASTNG